MLTPTDIYTLKNTSLLPLPQVVQDMIATMQLAPVAQVFAKKPYKKVTADRSSSWRTEIVVTLKKTEFKHDDPDYDAILAMTNKVAASCVVARAADIAAIIGKRDEAFRMRIVTLLFNRGVSMPFFSKLIANMFEILFATIPVIKEDVQFSCSIDTFNKMFDQNDTVVCPVSSDPDYANKLCAWTKKKDIRRGFGMFVTELHIRGLVDEDVIRSATTTTLDDLFEMIRKPTDRAVTETVDQLVTFLFESTKVLVTRFGKDHPIVKLVSAKSREAYATSKDSTPCLGMRSRFKLQDVGAFG